jgi:solute carrier family 25 oxoglutarate transporter 11
MQADSVLPPAERRGYTGIFNAVARIAREEGIPALWKGASPTMARAMAYNSVMMPTSDQCKEWFGPYMGGEESWNSIILSSICAGITAAVASLPFDMVKTRMQKQRPGPDGQLPYKGFFDCATKIFRAEGPASFFSGLSTYIFRISPHVILTLLFMDQMNKAIAAYKDENKAKTAELK